MSVELFLVGFLRRYYISDSGFITLVDAEGKTVAEALKALSIPPEAVSIVLVNGRQESKGYILKRGDRVKVLSLVGGG